MESDEWFDALLLWVAKVVPTGRHLLLALLVLGFLIFVLYVELSLRYG